ncbi:MAG: transcription factor [Candidatus Bathyarchaeia archaeon]
MSFVDYEALLKIAEVIGGKEAVKIVAVLSKVNETTDEEIVAKTEINLNDVRRILYRLYDRSLVGLRRTRDKETGWFLFHWRLQPDQLEGFVTNQKRKILEKLEARLEYEKSHDFYYCSTPGCKRVPFEEAIELVFQCPVCAKPLMHFDNGKIIHFLTKKIEHLRKEIGE